MSEGEYKKKYEGLEHTYYSKEWFSRRALRVVFIVKENIGRHTFASIANELIQRGHDVVFTADRNHQGDIGFYCDDIPIRGNQHLTIVTLNGLDQDHVVRPDYSSIFMNENWGSFDAAIVPGPRWALGWLTVLNSRNSQPKYGIYEVGWPKSDKLFDRGDPVKQRLATEPTGKILYAPQTEQDGKQTGVIEQLRQSGVRLSIKHWESEEYKEIYPSLLTDDYMNNLLSENLNAKSLPWVQILDSRSNFIDALLDCDILISDQSSVLYEAALVGAPTVTVKGWKHACGLCAGPQPSPDSCRVIAIEQLGSCIRQMLDDYRLWVHKAVNIRNDNFVNLGFSSIVVADLAESLFFKQRFVDRLCTESSNSCRYGWNNKVECGDGALRAVSPLGAYIEAIRTKPKRRVLLRKSGTKCKDILKRLRNKLRRGRS